MPFPELDPIPLPAPVWFFKTLHIATLSLHFVTVYLLVGGLILATIWNFLGRNKPSSVHAEASGAIAKRLPIVMTYLINLGVPPLLFAQVLYGRALYTSSVLIGAYWISVILLLMAGYYLLYKVSQRAEEGRSWWWLGILSFVLISYIARIYTANMTLMIRPEVWLDLYRGSSHGAVMPTGDPTVLPRWLFMMIGSVGVAGVAVALMGTTSKLSGEVKTFMRRWGRGVAAIFIAALASLFPWQLGPQADPLTPAPAGIHLEWYFMSQFQILKLFGRWFPGATGEALGIALFTAGLLLWALIPLYDTSTKFGRRARNATWLGVLALAGLIITTIWGYWEV
ncbi:MAG TPA: hypothetical protein VKD91_04635 [Pyrinomonadaceae bacterium]|nr:hypothetical protein [Pyrinomonadaceae bacterium]